MKAIGRPLTVVLVGIDGLGGYYMKREAENLETLMPTLHRLIVESPVATLSARSVFPSTSAPAWAAVLTGLPPEGTGIVDKQWEIPGPSPPDGFLFPSVTTRCPGAPHGMPFTLFEALGNHGVQSHLIVSWSWLTRLGCGQTVATSIDCQLDDAKVIQSFRKVLDDTIDQPHPNDHKRHFYFLHLDGVDAAGHRSGWGSEPYLQSWREADSHLLSILDALTGRARDRHEALAVVVVSDHGGKGTNHGEMDAENILVPFVVWSPDTALLEATIPHQDNQQAASLLDVAPTILSLFDIASPPWMRGAAMARFT